MAGREKTIASGAAGRSEPDGIGIFSQGSSIVVCQARGLGRLLGWGRKARSISTCSTDLRIDPHCSFRVLVKEICGRLGERHSGTLSNSKRLARQEQGQLWRK